MSQESDVCCTKSMYDIQNRCIPDEIDLLIDFYMANCHPGWQGYPTWQTGQPAQAGHPTYHVNVIKIK